MPISQTGTESAYRVSIANGVLRVWVNTYRIFVTVLTANAPDIDPGFSAALIHGPDNNIASLLFIFQNEGPESEMLRLIQCKYPRRRLISGVGHFERLGSYGLGWHGG
jgi:hypothetical protein